jgi:hypothetical protein
VLTTGITTNWNTVPLFPALMTSVLMDYFYIDIYMLREVTTSTSCLLPMS